MSGSVLINIDVPDLPRAIAFYCTAFGLSLSRRLGPEAAELTGWATPVYLLEKPDGTIGAGTEPRRYGRHWTPVHLDIVVDDLQAAVERATGAGATLQSEPRAAAWGRIAALADPFGHGICLIAFSSLGYDAILSSADP